MFIKLSFGAYFERKQMLTGDYPLALPIGTILAGQYEIDGILGQGGFGITYRAIDHKASKNVAVKEFFPDSLAARTGGTTVSAFSGDRSESFEYGKSCFLQEAETLAQFIGNENIVRVISYFEENGTAYFVMDFIEGLSFDDYITQRGGSISYEEACRVLVPIMEALQEVHRRGIIHRDVTPDNIFITKDGIPKLIDFGAARYSLGDKSQSLDVVLKHGFAPKEQYTRRGRQGPYTDVYSLGASFYYAITGKRPPDSIERMDEDNLIPPSARGIHIPYEAEEAILKALSLQPADRFQSMEEFERALLGPKTLSKKSAETDGVDRIAKTVAVPKDEGFEEDFRQYRASGAKIRRQESRRGDAGGRQSRRRSGINPALIIGAAAAVLILVTVIFTVRGIVKKNPKTEDSETTEANEETAEMSSEASDVSKEDTEEIPAPEDEDTDESAGGSTDAAGLVDESELTDEDLRYPEIIGNTSDNLMNYCPVGMNGEFYKYGEYLNACYSRTDNVVFYLKNFDTGEIRAYMKNEDTGEDVMIPQLESFSRIDRLLVSKAYYFVYVSKEKMMYCVNRIDGKIKNSHYVEDPRLCTFFEGYLYFTDDDGNGGQAVKRVPAGELDAEAEWCVDLDEGCSITVMGSYDEGIVFRETGNKVVIGLYTAKYLKDGEARLLEYETDYNYGKISELNALGTDIYFGGFAETDYSWVIGRFDITTGETTIITEIYSKYYIDLTLYEEGGEKKIAYYSYPKDSSYGDPYLGYMNLDGSDLSKIFLIRHD